MEVGGRGRGVEARDGEKGGDEVGVLGSEDGRGGMERKV